MGAYASVSKTKLKTGQWITSIDTKPLNQFSLLSFNEGSEQGHETDISTMVEK